MRAMAGANSDLYLHIRVIVSIILGLSVARLLNGIAGFVQHPTRHKVWWVHLAWVAWTLLSVVGFWWWEFRLAQVQVWTFGAYIFVLLYAAAFFMLSSVLFPNDIAEYAGFRDYFMSRRRWVFGLIALTFVMDVADTGLKGAAYAASLGPEYPIRIAVALAACAAGAWVKSTWVQAALVVCALVYQVSYFIRVYGVLG